MQICVTSAFCIWNSYHLRTKTQSLAGIQNFILNLGSCSAQGTAVSSVRYQEFRADV